MRLWIEPIAVMPGYFDLYINDRLIILARCTISSMHDMRRAVRGFGDVFELGGGKKVEVVHTSHCGESVRFELVNGTFVCVDRSEVITIAKPDYTISEIDGINIRKEFIRNSTQYGITALSKKYNIPAKVLSRFLAA